MIRAAIPDIVNIMPVATPDSLILSCLFAFAIGVVVGIALVLFTQIKNLSIQKKHSMKNAMDEQILNYEKPSSEDLYAGEKESVDGQNALKEFNR